MPTEIFAPAKINLALHVTGRRASGYHDLDSLVGFAEIGDRLLLEPAPQLSLTLAGPFGAALSGGEDNLVLRAARLMPRVPARITLDKRLPVASGIGGGSADAAAALRGLSRLTGRPLPPAADLLRLGADVPVCLDGRPCRMQGIGETITPLPALPPADLLLVNPGVALSTPAVFAALPRRDGPPMPPALPRLAALADLAAFLALQRNDLEPAAVALEPVVAEILAELARQPGCLLARMSGSGATCFGLFADAATCNGAAARFRTAHPGWWIAATRLRPA